MDDLPVVHQVALHAGPAADGLRAYERLWANSNWWTSLENLVIFSILYIGLATVIGLLLAILLDQKIRGEGVLRTIYLYPMALSFIVTGTAWKWLLNPGIGIQKIVRDWGFESFTLDWIVQPEYRDLLYRDRRDLAIQRLRHGDVPRWVARRRQRDHQGGADRRRPIFKIYWRIIIPLMRPVFLSAS